MGLETGTYIDDLVITNPLGTDDRSTADDHMRLIKKVLKNTLPNADAAINPSVAEFNLLVGLLATASELNILDGALLSTTELNKLNGVTATTAEFNRLVGVLGTIIDSQGGQTIADLIITNALTLNGELELNAGYSEDADSYGLGGAITLNLAIATYWYPTGDLTSIPTFTFSNPASTGRVTSFTLEMHNADGFAPVWPSGVDWAQGVEPTWSAGVDFATFLTRDGGTTWGGFFGGRDFS